MQFKLSRDLFNDYCSHVNFDTNLVRQLEMFQIGFMTKNEDHINFFGGNLLGLHRVRFSNQDKMRWFDEVLRMDPQTLQDEIKHLPHIDIQHKVSSDVFNLSCIWLIYKINNSVSLNQAQKDKGMLTVGIILFYRFFTSRYCRHFPYLTDKATALATLNALSNRFDIKRLGSWQAVITKMAETMIKRGSSHWPVFEKMEDDLKVVRVLNDMSSRNRAMLKGIYAVFKDVHAKGIKVYSTSANVVLDGEDMLRDKKEGVTKYTRYLSEIIVSEESFIKQELENVVQELMPTMSPRMLHEVLQWFVGNQKPGDNLINKLLDTIIKHAYDLVSTDRSLMRDGFDLMAVLFKLRGIYTSSKAKDPKLLMCRKELDKIGKKVLRTSNNAAISSARTGIMLYVVLRTFTMNYYTSRAKTI